MMDIDEGNKLLDNIQYCMSRYFWFYKYHGWHQGWVLPCSGNSRLANWARSFAGCSSKSDLDVSFPNYVHVLLPLVL